MQMSQSAEYVSTNSGWIIAFNFGFVCDLCEVEIVIAQSLQQKTSKFKCARWCQWIRTKQLKDFRVTNLAYEIQCMKTFFRSPIHAFEMAARKRVEFWRLFFINSCDWANVFLLRINQPRWDETNLNPNKSSGRQNLVSAPWTKLERRVLADHSSKKQHPGTRGLLRPSSTFNLNKRPQPCSPTCATITNFFPQKCDAAVLKRALSSPRQFLEVSCKPPDNFYSSVVKTVPHCGRDRQCHVHGQTI